MDAKSLASTSPSLQSATTAEPKVLAVVEESHISAAVSANKRLPPRVTPTSGNIPNYTLIGWFAVQSIRTLSQLLRIIQSTNLNSAVFAPTHVNVR